ncbi:excisionase family DNA-binding protein [Actinocrinis puniceicyclus]|uniref:excisionase family DNA-binding protein n=1 Tax=Actinocrinis puniceicyclus TaxID=977794 RepID=UPI001FEC0E59|nr:helix-turn-helix domain-containing protein [Actinocrinis puniceicyclus]
MTVEQAAELFNTTPRFVRRLVAERRITVVRLGRHVRIPRSAVVDFVQAGTVLPLSTRRAVRHLTTVA